MSDTPVATEAASPPVVTTVCARRLSVDAVRAWLNENKIFFETVAAFVVAFAGLVVAGYFGIVQNRLAEKQIELAESELELSRIETAVARAGVEPRITFSCEELKKNDSWLVTVNANDATVYELSVQCVGFLEVTNSKNVVTRIELRDMFHSLQGPVVHGNNAKFFWLADLIPNEFLGYQFTDLQSYFDYLPVPANDDPVSLRTKVPSVVPSCYFVVTYYDATRRHHRQVFEANPLGQYAKPIDLIPKFDHVIETKPFIEKGKVDVQRYIAAVRPFLPSTNELKNSTSR